MFTYVHGSSGNIHKELAMPVASGENQRTEGQKGHIRILLCVDRFQFLCF